MGVLSISEKFKSVQGEGVYAGAPMAFIRTVGCSVGKKICQHCDTDFEAMHSWRGGGEFSPYDLIQWARPFERVCLTGGEPLDQPDALLVGLVQWMKHHYMVLHVETSGTKPLPEWLIQLQNIDRAWVCVSPKPGWHEETVLQANEIKVIVPGLGDINPKVDSHWLVHPFAESDGILKRWPTLDDAKRWANLGKTVFLQPRNQRHDIDANNLRIVQDLVVQHPNLRLSVQLHKILKVQ